MGAIYIGLMLSELDRDYILERFAPRHPNVFADHVTLTFKPDEMQTAVAEKEFKGRPVECHVLAHVFDDKAQALWIGCNYHCGIDHTLIRNEILHITISCADGVSPVYSNEMLKKSLVDRFILHRFFGFVNVVRHEDREKYQLSDELCRRRGIPVPKK